MGKIIVTKLESWAIPYIFCYAMSCVKKKKKIHLNTLMNEYQYSQLIIFIIIIYTQKKKKIKLTAKINYNVNKSVIISGMWCVC